MIEKQITQELLKDMKEVMHYDADAGIFVWLVKPGGRGKIGRRAGWLNPINGYRYIKIRQKQYLEHRMVWLYVYGRLPLQEIDHIDGVRINNKIANLREATRGQNLQNTAKSPRNTSGVPGVSWAKANGKWTAHIKVNKVQKNLGYFDSIGDASDVYRAAKARLHTFNPTVRAA